MTTQPPPPLPEKTPPVLPLFALFAVYNFLMPAMIEGTRSEVVVGLFSGPVGAQLGLLAIWAALGPRPWRVRLPTTLIIAMALRGILVLGAMASLEPSADEVRDRAQSLLFVPLVFLAAQLPLWILRVATGYRIVLDANQQADPPTESRQFGVQHILVATALVAIALGLASTALAPQIERSGAASAWIRLLILCVVCSLWSAFFTLPCLWAAFVAQDKGLAAMAIGGYDLFMSFFLMVVIGALTGMPPFGLVLLFNATLTAVMLGTLHVARACGYVFVRPRRAKPPVAPAESPTATDPSDPSPPPNGP